MVIPNVGGIYEFGVFALALAATLIAGVLLGRWTAILGTERAKRGMAGKPDVATTQQAQPTSIRSLNELRRQSSDFAQALSEASATLSALNPRYAQWEVVAEEFALTCLDEARAATEQEFRTACELCLLLDHLEDISARTSVDSESRRAV